MDTFPVSATDGFGFKFDNTYQQLPPIFYQPQQPTAVKNPSIAIFNDALAQSLELNVAGLKQQGAGLFIGQRDFCWRTANCAGLCRAPVWAF